MFFLSLKRMHVRCGKFRECWESEKTKSQTVNVFHVVVPFTSFFMLIAIFLFIKLELHIFLLVGLFFFFLTQHIMSISHSWKNTLFNGHSSLFFVCFRNWEFCFVFKRDVLKEEILEHDDWLIPGNNRGKSLCYLQGFKSWKLK